MPRRLLLFALVLAACFVVPRVPWLVAWDEKMVAGMAALRSPGWDRLFWPATKIGATPGFLAAMILPPLGFLFQRRFGTALYYFVGIGLLKLSVSLVKVLVARPRPLGGLEFNPTLSMPSGHAANAVFMFGALALFIWNSRLPGFWRAFILPFCCFGYLSIALSRVYLGVHYPSDVVLGSLYAASGLWILVGLRPDLFSPSALA